MAGFSHVFKQDYDKRIKVGDEYVFCYSKKKLSELYPKKDFLLSGEARRGSQKSRERFDVSQAKKLERRKQKGLEGEDVKTLKVGDLNIGKSVLSVYPKGTNNKVLGKTDGYVCISDGNFIALCASRVPFLAIVTSMTAAILASLFITFGLLLNPESPLYINPNNRLPVIDPTVTPMENDDSDKIISENGGGSITIRFAGPVRIYLSKQNASITYSNPNASNHDVVVELYLKDEEKEYFLGRSGRIPAGNTLNEISIKDRKVDLKEGDYKGKLYIHSYDPLTGERAIVVTDINDVDIIVKN